MIVYILLGQEDVRAMKRHVKLVVMSILATAFILASGLALAAQFEVKFTIDSSMVLTVEVKDSDDNTVGGIGCG